MGLSNMYANSIDMPLYTDKELEELDRRIMDGDNSARKEYILGNLRLVVSIAKRYQTSFLDMDDLVQAGNLGLIKASEVYDPTKENKFSTYAVYWIRQAIGEEIEKREKIIRFPSSMNNKIKQIRRAVVDYVNTYGERPTIYQLSEITNLPVEQIKSFQHEIINPLSLNQIVNKEGDELQNIIPDSVDVEEKYIDREVIKQALSTIGGRDLEIILYRYGFYDGIPKTQKETAKYIGGITRERIRQIEKRVLNELRDNIICNEQKRK